MATAGGGGGGGEKSGGGASRGSPCRGRDRVHSSRGQVGGGRQRACASSANGVPFTSSLVGGEMGTEGPSWQDLVGVQRGEVRQIA